MTKEYTTQEKLDLMEPHMKKTWGEIDNIFFSLNEGISTFSKTVWAEDWAEAKFPIFQKMGNQLRLSTTVENAMSDSDILSMFRSTVISYLDNMNATSREKIIITIFFLNLSIKELQSNRFTENREILGVKMNKGAKVSKSLKRVLPNPKLVNEIQIRLSIFNESLLSRGTLEMSIDPIDILMMSVNQTRDWTSCHSIFDGCYGAGPISYLLDPSTFICQVTLGDQSSIPDKIWRRMGMFNDDLDVICLSKSYPSINKNNDRALQQLLKDTFGEEKIAYGFVDSDQIHDLITNCGELHYNDITHDAMSIVPMIVLDREKYNIVGKNNSKQIFRSHFEDDSQDSLLTTLDFTVGVDSVTSPTLDFTITGSVEEGGVFEELYDDDYYDDEEDWD